MKLSKLFLAATLVAFYSCSNDANTEKIQSETKKNHQSRIDNNYSLDEIISGLQHWENNRANTELLKSLFEKGNGFYLDMSKFPLGNEVHAYPCILDGILKFALISEVYDNESYVDNIRNYIIVTDLINFETTTLADEIYPNLTYELPTQYIAATDAINRIKDWEENSTNWINTNLPVYQLFSMPTYSLTTNSYKVYFGLKQNDEATKTADLILSHSDAFYDTVLLFPPRRGRSLQLIDLIK
jgi:hypothetical protein